MQYSIHINQTGGLESLRLEMKNVEKCLVDFVGIKDKKRRMQDITILSLRTQLTFALPTEVLIVYQ